MPDAKPDQPDGSSSEAERLLAQIAEKFESGDFDLDDISSIKRQFGIGLEPDSIRAISQVLRQKRPCNMLVFGLGNDSLLWERLNPGRTVFLEDNLQWYHKVVQRSPGLEAFMVDYDSKIEDYQWYLDNEWANCFALPDEIAGTRWDLILVDGPAGFGAGTSGRMKSIRAASGLVAAGADVFVDDCDRSIEAAFADRYLGRTACKSTHVSAQFRHIRVPETGPGIADPVAQPFFGKREIYLKATALIRLFAVKRVLAVGGVVEVCDLLVGSGVEKVEQIGGSSGGGKDGSLMVVTEPDELDAALGVVWEMGLHEPPLFMIQNPHCRSIDFQPVVESVFGGWRCGISSVSARGGGRVEFVLPKGRN